MASRYLRLTSSMAAEEATAAKVLASGLEASGEEEEDLDHRDHSTADPRTCRVVQYTLFQEGRGRFFIVNFYRERDV